MGTNGLEDDYYLSGNNIWVKVLPTDYDNTKTAVRLDFFIENLFTLKSIPVLKMYPNPTKDFSFNICLPVRALQPEPDQVTPSYMMSKFRFTFSITYSDDTVETIQLEKFFIRGGINKRGADNWFLNSSAPLIIEKWVQWTGIPSPGNPSRIQGDTIVDFVPSPDMIYNFLIPGNCNYKIIKFLNSLGGYQYWIFEYNERALKTKGKGSIYKIADALKFDVSKSLGIEEDEVLNLKSKTPAALQPIVMDLIKSQDIYLFHPEGNEPYSQWERLELSESNEAVLNSFSMTYLNEISFKIPNYVTRDL